MPRKKPTSTISLLPFELWLMIIEYLSVVDRFDFGQVDWSARRMLLGSWKEACHFEIWTNRSPETYSCALHFCCVETFEIFSCSPMRLAEKVGHLLRFLLSSRIVKNLRSISIKDSGAGSRVFEPIRDLMASYCRNPSTTLSSLSLTLPTRSLKADFLESLFANSLDSLTKFEVPSPLSPKSLEVLAKARNLSELILPKILPTVGGGDLEAKEDSLVKMLRGKHLTTLSIGVIHDLDSLAKILDACSRYASLKELKVCFLTAVGFLKPEMPEWHLASLKNLETLKVTYTRGSIDCFSPFKIALLPALKSLYMSPVDTYTDIANGIIFSPLAPETFSLTVRSRLDSDELDILIGFISIKDSGAGSRVFEPNNCLEGFTVTDTSFR